MDIFILSLIFINSPYYFWAKARNWLIINSISLKTTAK